MRKPDSFAQLHPANGMPMATSTHAQPIIQPIAQVVQSPPPPTPNIIVHNDVTNVNQNVNQNYGGGGVGFCCCDCCCLGGCIRSC